MGRKQAEIDWPQVTKMLQAGCSIHEIAAHWGYHPNTLYHACERDNEMTYPEFRRKWKRSGNALLRLKKFKLAMDGDRTMLIWEDKQRLGGKEDGAIKIKGLNNPDNNKKIEALLNAISKGKISVMQFNALLSGIKTIFELQNGTDALEKLEKLEGINDVKMG